MRRNGFVLTELFVTLLVLVVLAAFAAPAYKNYERRAYFNHILETVASYKTAVAECFQNVGTLQNCRGGTNHIPANITTPKEAVASLTVVSGVISVVPVAHKGVVATDTYVLTPKPVKNKLTWDASGNSVTKGYT